MKIREAGISEYLCLLSVRIISCLSCFCLMSHDVVLRCPHAPEEARARHLRPGECRLEIFIFIFVSLKLMDLIQQLSCFSR